MLLKVQNHCKKKKKKALSIQCTAVKLDVERSGCQNIQDICETLCHSLECFSEFPPRKEKSPTRS